jgi:hypothetical protein
VLAQAETKSKPAGQKDFLGLGDFDHEGVFS